MKEKNRIKFINNLSSYVIYNLHCGSGKEEGKFILNISTFRNLQPALWKQGCGGENYEGIKHIPQSVICIAKE